MNPPAHNSHLPTAVHASPMALNQPAVGATYEEEVIDLRQYWRTLMRYRWGIVGFSFVVTVLTVLVLFSMKPVYKATATLLIENQNANVVSIEEVYGLESTNQEYFLTQFEILKSRSLAEKVILKLNLQSHPEFQEEEGFDWKGLLPFELPGKAEELSESARFNRFVDSFIERVAISPVRKTQLAKVSFEANDAQLAADVANELGMAYIESGLEAKLEVTVQASSWLNDRMGNIKAELNAAELALQQYKDKEGLVGKQGGTDIANKEVDLVADKLVDARKERLALEGVYQQIRTVGSNNSEGLQRISGVLRDKSVQNYKESLLEVELKRSELAKRYGYKHPKMIAVESEVLRAKAALDAQVVSVAKGIESDYRAAVASERSLDNALAGTKGNLQSLSRKRFKLRELEQNVETKRAIYNTFLQRINETSATGDLNTANARIVDPAVVPVLPAKPKKGLIAALAMVVSGMFAVMCAFLLEALNNTIKTTEDIEQKLQSTMLGLLPLIKSKGKDKAIKSYRAFVEGEDIGFGEAVRTIRTGIVLSSLDSPEKTISVTSTVPSEGKTSTSISLACALSQMEKTLLIDADMRRPSIGKVLGLDRAKPGLSALVAGTADLSDCIQRYEEGDVDVMLAGLIPPNPLELLSSKRFAQALKVLEDKYDRIVIDLPPCQAVSDALAIAPLVGAMVYVVKADSTSATQVKAGLKRLRDINAPLVGVILNQVDLDKSSRYYGSDYYAGYYDSYGYAAETAKANKNQKEEQKIRAA
ncbi:MAG: polysaccharide biosynthesis tyrosine autokinase [Cellvibrionaceae bacterium]|nr:polysaccharide biosynthesis tyrosine autokinase [Cellvibrionaceae bacterium]